MKTLLYFADFRSDTVTRPSEGMRKAMFSAPVGDDVLGDDPTVLRLEAMTAELFGKEAAVFCPSGTMTNQIAINVHTKPGDELICSPLAHIYNYEGGGVAFNSGVQVRVTGDAYGRVTPAGIAELIQSPTNVHSAPTRLVVMENTSNKGGGTCLGLPLLTAVGAVAREHHLAYHLDGARLWNALQKDNESTESYGKLFDTLSVCLSKGLGCPVGSLVVGDSAFGQEARRIRKRFGGGMRQSGLLAAAGIYALENNRQHLQEDHDKIQEMDHWLSSFSWVAERKPVETNIVIFALGENHNAQQFQSFMTEQGIGVAAMDSRWLRLVTHRDIQQAQMDVLHKALHAYHLSFGAL